MGLHDQDGLVCARLQETEAPAPTARRQQSHVMAPDSVGGTGAEGLGVADPAVAAAIGRGGGFIAASAGGFM